MTSFVLPSSAYYLHDALATTPWNRFEKQPLRSATLLSEPAFGDCNRYEFGRKFRVLKHDLIMNQKNRQSQLTRTKDWDGKTTRGVGPTKKFENFHTVCGALGITDGRRSPRLMKSTVEWLYLERYRFWKRFLLLIFTLLAVGFAATSQHLCQLRFYCFGVRFSNSQPRALWFSTSWYNKCCKKILLFSICCK